MSTFTAGLPNGNAGPVATVGLLASDLEELVAASGLLEGTTVEVVRAEHPNTGDGVRAWARFGAAVLIPLVRFAVAERVPIVLDY